MRKPLNVSNQIPSDDNGSHDRETGGEGEDSSRPASHPPEPCIEHPVSVKINEACLNGDEDCPCVHREEKHEYNPV